MGVLAIPLVAIAFGLSVAPAPAAATAQPFAFTTAVITPAALPFQQIREVNPSVEHIASWISSVGAGVASADLDGDSLADDLCSVDPRSDSVAIYESDPENLTTRPVGVLVDRNGIAGTGAARLNYDSGAQAPMGCRVADLDRDGWNDLVVYFWGRAPVAFLNGGDWQFEAQEIVDGGADLDWYTNTVTFADFDGDGQLDIFVGNYFADGAELLDPASTKPVAMNNSLSRAFNGGTNIILLGRSAQASVDGGRTEATGPTYELRTDVFSDVDARGWTLAAAAADFNGDLLPELYVANDFGPDRFFVNRSSGGALRFESVDGGLKGIGNPRSTMIGRDSFKGMGASIADVNGDGLYDIYVSNITHEFGLFESQLLFLGAGLDATGVPQFRAGAEELGVARTAFSWDNKIADLDNDGQNELLQATGFIRGTTDRWPEVQELALSNDVLIADPQTWPPLADADISGQAPRVVLTRNESGKFANVAVESGLTDIGVMRGIALTDLDGDGDLDWIEANQWADSRLVVNECGDCDAFVGLRIIQGRVNRQGDRPTDGGDPVVLNGLHAQNDIGGGGAAVGATVTVATADGTHRSFVDGGNGHGGQSSSDVHLGLGAAAQGPVNVQLEWRDGSGAVKAAEIKVDAGWNTVVLP